MSEKFLTFQPGEYYDFEKAAVEERFAQARGEKPIPPMFPGMDPTAPRPFTEEAIIARNRLYNPFDPLYTDPEFARAHGHPSCPAMPGMIMACGSPQGFSKDTGDLWYYTNDGTVVRMYQDIYGDTMLAPKNIVSHMKDVTQPGSDVRMMFMGGECDGYNEAGEKVYHAFTNTRDCWRKYKDDVPASERQNFTENMAEWTTYFPEQIPNGDAEYERMFKIWDNEVIAGDNTPFWEDVEVGTFLPETCSDGPITFMHIIAWQNMGTMSLFNREELRDLDFMKKNYFQDRFGSFLDETALHYSGRNIPGSRMAMYNNTCADLIYRTVTNWMGYKGRITQYAWHFFPFFRELDVAPLCAEEFNLVPGYEGKALNLHPSEGDIVIGKACVIGKYVNELGEHIVKIMLWAENMHGALIQGCPMEVALPSRG